MMTVEEAVEWLLGGQACESCGGNLPGPGEPCDACGTLPPVTSAELSEQLSGPMALAKVEEAKLRREGWAMLDAAVARLADADRPVHLAVLRERRDQAQRALDTHVARQKPLEAPLRAARKAEQKSGGELAAAREQLGAVVLAEEIARRMRHGLQAETDAKLRLDTAAAVLRRYESAAAEATAARQAAESALAASRERTGHLEAARDLAAATLSSPGQVPRSPQTITAGLARLVLSGQLDEIEAALAGQIARTLCAVTGATADIIEEARRDLLAEQEAGKRNQPLHVKALGDGNVAVTPNLLNPATPQPFHPAAPGNAPSGVQPGLTPYFGT